MRTLLRYLILSGILLGLAVGAFVWRIDGRSVYSHLSRLSEGSFESVLAEIKSELAEENKPKAKKRKNERDQAVAKLEVAAKKSSPKPKPRVLKKRATTTDRSVSEADEAALDRLLSQKLK